MARPLAIALLTAALLLAPNAGAQERPNIKAEPQVLEISLGHSRIIDTTLEHAGIVPRMRWEMLPPGTPGEVWGWLNQNGRYTAPPELPPGELRIVVHLLNEYGRPLASAVIPVVFE